MSGLEMFVTQYLARTSGIYYARQFAVIMVIFVFGAILTDHLSKDSLSLAGRCTIAFPTGIAAFSVTAYAMLVIGIPYNSLSVCLICAAEAVIAIVAARKKFDRHLYAKHMVFVLVAALGVAAFATSGLTPVSVTNDTMYYFRRYPDAIVHYGYLRDQFDVFMTDTGLGSVSIDTLPALFGFGESFGIRESFNISFVLFFASRVYDRAKKHLEGKAVVVATVLVTLTLAVSTPFVLLGHWALANMYFMELFFIAAYYVFDEKTGWIGIEPILLLALAFLRIEGILFVLWLIICVSLYRDVGRKLVYTVIIPMMVLFGLYCLKVFVQFNVLDNIYEFLTPQKAALIVGAIAATGIYLLFIYPVLSKRFAKYLPYVYILALVTGNTAMCIMNTERYVANLEAFGLNLFKQSGWGMLPYFVIMMTALLVIEYVTLFIKEKKKPGTSDSFNITLTVGFILMVLAASYGRGDVLNAYVGDSGNRVLLQVVPLIVMMYGELFMGLAETQIDHEKST